MAQRALEFVEKFNGLRRIAGKTGSKASLGRRLPDERAQHPKMADMCRCEHFFLADAETLFL